MTVTYSLDVATSSFWSLYKLLFRWKGSIWKYVTYDLMVWSALYAIISATYRMAMNSNQRMIFEDICIFFDKYSEFIPMTFMLGFYVSTVFSRWWDIFNNVGWIDTPALLIAANIDGEDEKSRILRRNLIRYLVLTQALVYRDVSACVKKRFPTMNHLVTSGLLSEREKQEFDKIESPHIKYWQPMHWVFSLLKKAHSEGKMSDIIYIDMLEKMRQYRVNVLNLTLYDWVSVPLGYTQVVHFAVRSYFFIALLGRQYLDITRDIPEKVKKTVDLYVPIMTILQFLFFVGWMKVAEVLLNPLGEDDDDFECNYILDRNLQVGFAIVDEAYTNLPPLEKDSFWDVRVPEPLYTTEAANRPVNPAIGSCVEMATEFDKCDKTDEEAVMVRPRRRSVRRRTLEWDQTSDIIVPVFRGGHPFSNSVGAMNRNKYIEVAFSSTCPSVESFGNLGESIARPNSRMKDIWKKLNRQRFSASVNSYTSRVPKSTRSNSVASSFPSVPPSRQESFVSITPSMLSIEIQTEEGNGDKDKAGIESPKPNAVWKVDEMLPAIPEADERKSMSRDNNSMKSANSSTLSTNNSHEHSLDSSSGKKKEDSPESIKEEEGSASDNPLYKDK